MIFIDQVKKEEYREIKPYWTTRIDNGPYDKMIGVNGYGNSRPRGIVEVKGIRLGTGRPEWGAVPGRVYWVIELGNVLELK
jgi:hypothetical protein